MRRGFESGLMVLAASNNGQPSLNNVFLGSFLWKRGALTNIRMLPRQEMERQTCGNSNTKQYFTEVQDYKQAQFVVCTYTQHALFTTTICAQHVDCLQLASDLLAACRWNRLHRQANDQSRRSYGPV